MVPTIHGIKSCDTVRKARGWLDRNGVAYRFHDFRSEGLDAATLDRWLSRLPWETLLNKASATFRALPERERSDLDAARARRLMLAEPTLIKRPVLEAGDTVMVGFSPDRYADWAAGS